MGMDALRELAPFVKEALQKTATLAKTFCFLHVINNYLCNVGLLVGPSMLPAFNHGNLVLAESITRRFGKVGSGDVVFIRSPVEPRKIITKRVKGVEGDIVSYVVDPNKSDEQKSVVVPKGHVWIEGDNPLHSKDSREFGPVPYAHIESRIFSVVWPPKDFGLVSNKVL